MRAPWFLAGLKELGVAGGAFPQYPMSVTGHWHRLAVSLVENVEPFRGTSCPLSPKASTVRVRRAKSLSSFGVRTTENSQEDVCRILSSVLELPHLLTSLCHFEFNPLALGGPRVPLPSRQRGALSAFPLAGATMAPAMVWQTLDRLAAGIFPSPSCWLILET